MSLPLLLILLGAILLLMIIAAFFVASTGSRLILEKLNFAVPAPSSSAEFPRLIPALMIAGLGAIGGAFTGAIGGFVLIHLEILGPRLSHELWMAVPFGANVGMLTGVVVYIRKSLQKSKKNCDSQSCSGVQ